MSSTGLVIGVISFLLIIVIGGIVYVYRKYNNPSSQEDSPPVSLPSPQPQIPSSPPPIPSQGQLPPPPPPKPPISTPITSSNPPPVQSGPIISNRPPPPPPPPQPAQPPSQPLLPSKNLPPPPPPPPVPKPDEKGFMFNGCACVPCNKADPGCTLSLDECMAQNPNKWKVVNDRYCQPCCINDPSCNMDSLADCQKRVISDPKPDIMNYSDSQLGNPSTDTTIGWYSFRGQAQRNEFCRTINGSFVCDYMDGDTLQRNVPVKRPDNVQFTKIYPNTATAMTALHLRMSNPVFTDIYGNGLPSDVCGMVPNTIGGGISPKCVTFNPQSNTTNVFAGVADPLKPQRAVFGMPTPPTASQRFRRSVVKSVNSLISDLSTHTEPVQNITSIDQAIASCLSLGKDCVSFAWDINNKTLTRFKKWNVYQDSSSSVKTVPGTGVIFGEYHDN